MNFFFENKKDFTRNKALTKNATFAMLETIYSIYVTRRIRYNLSNVLSEETKLWK